MRIRLLPLSALSLLTGCSFTPHYVRPAMPVPTQWPSALQSATGSGTAADGIGWKQFYTAPQIQRLIQLGLDNNRDLRQAALNVEAFRAQYRIQHADLLPTIGANATGSLERLPANVSTTGQSGVFHEYGLTVGVSSYELDIFGRIRSLNQAALQNYLATREARRTVQISLVADIGISFLTLETDRQRLAVGEQTLDNYRSALGLIDKALAAGTATALDRRQEETLIASTQADVESYRRTVTQDINALQLLVGTTLPAGFDDGFAIADGVVTPVPAGLPSDLLDRRPDIMEAEHQLLASNANIGAAKAAFFPQITLTGSGGTLSAAVSSLFAGGQGAWTFAPQISVPIFSGGRLKGNLAYAKAERDIEVAAYQKAIQVAFREVADGLAARSTFGDQLRAQQSEIRSAQAYLDLANRGYQAGIQNYLVVLDAQRTVFSARQQYLVSRLAQLTSEVSLYKALGGGWQAGPVAKGA